MGNALAIAATTRILREIVEGNVTRYGLDGYVGENVLVTAEPSLDDTTRHRINLFLYRAVESPLVRNDPLPSHDHLGRPVASPVLALDLHYAVTAFADSDYQSEMLLGCALQAFLEVPVIDRRLIREILGMDSGSNTLMDARLFEQIQSIRVRHRNLSEEAFSRVWSTFHVPYRLTAFYEVSVVLLAGDGPSRMPMPVLSRPEPRAHASLAPVTPTLIESRPDAVAPGETASLMGLSLGGGNVQVEPAFRDPSVVLAPLGIPSASASDNEVEFTVPASWPVGSYELRVSMETVPGGSRRVSNRVPFMVLPDITVSAITRDPGPSGQVTVQLSVSPEIQPGQQVQLVLGGRLFPGPVLATPTGSLEFSGLEVAPGTVSIRLLVDGVGSAWLDRSTSPATVLPSATVVVP